MAVPVYNHDLIDIDLAESTTGYSAYGGGASGLGTGADFSMQGTLCVDKQVTNAEKGVLFSLGSNISTTNGEHVFTWHYTATPGVTATLVNRGVVINIGSATNAYCSYHVEGSDTYGAAGRVGKCYVIDPTVYTSNTGSVPYRTVTGNPNGTFSVFGSGLSTIASVKAANMGLDAQRYGTGAYITAGDSGTPATFDGFSTQNDLVANRWGILNKVGGSYELQGAFVIGQNNTGTATLAYFDDSDVSIAIVDTPHSSSTFTKILVDHASTVCTLTNISLTALGTNNKGLFEVTSNNPTVTITNGTWTGLGVTTLQSNTSVDGLTWRACGVITLNGASVDNALIESSTATSAVVTSDLTLLSNNRFVSSGTGHAVELTSLGTGTMSWANTATNYVAGSSGSPVTPTSTGNETIYVNVASGTLTINVAAGATVPSIRSAGATVNVVAGLVTLTIQTQDGNEVRIRQGSYTIQHTQDVTGGEVTYSYTYAANTKVTISVGGAGYIRQSDVVTLPATDSILTRTLDPDPSYLS